MINGATSYACETVNRRDNLQDGGTASIHFRYAFIASMTRRIPLIILIAFPISHAVLRIPRRSFLRFGNETNESFAMIAASRAHLLSRNRALACLTGNRGNASVNTIEDTYVINLSQIATAPGDTSRYVVSEDAGIRGKVLAVRVQSPALPSSTGDRWGNYCEVC